MTFWPRPNMLRFPNRCRILKTTAAKGPFCTGAHSISKDFAKFGNASIGALVNSCFRVAKAFSIFFFPFKSNVFFKYFIKRCSQSAKISNKPPIETC